MQGVLEEKERGTRPPAGPCHGTKSKAPAGKDEPPLSQGTENRLGPALVRHAVRLLAFCP